MATQPSFAQRAQIAQEVRKRFVAEAGRAMVEIATTAQERLTTLLNESGPSREQQIRRDAWTFYQRARVVWLDGTLALWQKSLAPPAITARAALDDDALQLVATDVVENKIVASRLVLSVVEKVSSELDDVRVRIKLLEGAEDLAGHDILRPEVLILQMIEQWAVAGMPRDSWPLVNDVVQRLLSERLKAAYGKCNEFLINQGILPSIDLKDRVKRVPKSNAPARGIRKPGQAPDAGPTTGGGVSSPSGSGDLSNYGGAGAGAGAGYNPPPDQYSARPGGAFGGRLGWGADAGSPAGGAAGSPAGGASGGASGSAMGGASGGAMGGASSQRYASNLPLPPVAGIPGMDAQRMREQRAAAAYANALEETRMLTATTPLAKARSRALGVMGQLKRLLVGRIGSENDSPSSRPSLGASPALAAAIAVRPQFDADAYTGGGTVMQDYTPAGVARVADRLREQTVELKKKAETKGEKATIEIVALMFQAILQEDRIPPGIRVWFARLQMPVLRVALEEPDFFGTLDHPARQLIDRMGSCVMGFDASGIQGSSLEGEIKRVVQVIEQYPETGKRVYQLVYDEFQKFLAKFLTEKGSTQKVVSVAQQVEQKETMTIQYTIEMRNMLKDMPVRDEIREFLFKVWAEVLAVVAVRKGPQHAETLELKKSASELVWAASAKPNRADRARVIAELPNLLQRLRTGMSLLGLAPSQQEAHLKIVSDTLADAFLSKTQAIPQAQIEAMAKRLANLEDFVSEDGMGDLPLDADSIEIMLGIDASTIDVVADGGSKPNAAMLAWAQEIQLGSWFTLDHNGRVAQVQFAWRSERKHLHLFASTAGHSYLIQAGRLAAYLQAGLLLPQEEETLTVRATRDALAKLEANPQRLLA